MSEEVPRKTFQTKPIQGYGGYYRVGNDGSVWSCRKRGGARAGPDQVDEWARLKFDTSSPGGYQRVRLTKNKRMKAYFVHVLVLTAFRGPKPEGKESRHLDSNSQNNNLSNLRWGTKLQNTKDRIKCGRQIRGEKHPHSRLTDKLVRWVLRQLKKGIPAYRLSVELGIPHCAIYRIKHRRNWTHVSI